MSSQILWFVTRGSGIVSLVLATVVTCLGILTVLRWQRPGWPRFLTAELHRTLALLSVVFVGLHVVTAVLDPFTALGWAAALIPFASSYRPLWVGLGVISMDLVLAMIATSLLRDRIGQRAWRAVHWAAYLGWPLALVHSIKSGSDAAAPWMIGISIGSIFAVVGALAWRLLAARTGRAAYATVAAGTWIPPIAPALGGRRRVGGRR